MPTGVYIRTEEHRRKLRGRVPWNKGKKCPELSGENNGMWGKSGTKGSFKPEELHLNWKGDSAKHSAIHTWVRRQKGKPRLCKVCGTTTAKMYDWSNKDHSYKRILSDYVRMCRSCHKLYDIKNKLIIYKKWKIKRT